MNNPEMPSKEVIFLYKQLEKINIPIWIDGGWGVDALLGKQTRIHNDLDIVIQKQHLIKFSYFLENQSYKIDSDDEEASPWNFVLKNNKGYKVDVHVITFNQSGDGLYGPLERGLIYPADSLLGLGKIEGVEVRCITPEYMVKFHTGYKLREHDYKDVTALCEKFNLALPKEYSQSSIKWLQP